MNQDLLRQRRNLVAISAILLVFDFANVQITKISVIGTELLVGNVNVLMVCAWVLWAYFLLRYYQYWRAEPHKHIRDTFKQEFKDYTKSYITADQTKKLGVLISYYRIERTASCTWGYVPQKYDPARDRPIDKDKTIHNIPTLRFMLWGAKSALYVCFQTPHVTDHILPFALAFAAPIWNLYTYGHPRP